MRKSFKIFARIGNLVDHVPTSIFVMAGVAGVGGLLCVYRFILS